MRKIYTGLQKSRLERARRKALKHSLFSRNIIPNKSNDFYLYELVTKFIISIILIIVMPKQSFLNKSKNRELVNRTYEQFVSNDSVYIPIAQSFYLLVSFVPIVTLVISILNLIPGYGETFINEILGRMIPAIKNVITGHESILDSGGKFATYIVLLSGSLWIASSGWGRFVFTQNYIYGHESPGNWFYNRFKGFLIVSGIALYLLFFSIIYTSFYRLATRNMDVNSYDRSALFYSTFSIFVFGFLYLGLSLLYLLTPSFKQSWKGINAGAMVATIPNVFFITIFGFLTSRIDYNQYGIISAFMYIALFISYFSYFIYLGIIVNESYYKTYISNYTISRRFNLFAKYK
ncbi:YhjD/YihY/BrkB family envelope integrity protein [Mycoplasmopsis opalescens]|uniref:YhjD/YihY/BrkB family envelope integrity protein n=1 Tax=Mycoplasmopsis opalescens TaxID=114886 RepID=UPI0004A74835|nr:YhjD/YihY/BrkB family envelope integrity protein [Mycoplasmopsis opalescens]